MSKKSENIALQRRQAEAKREAILANSAALQAKLLNIQKQLSANQEKLNKIDFFLTKLPDTTGEEEGNSGN